MKILIINGPNLNLLGKREPEIYGSTTFEDYYEELKAEYKGQGVDLYYFQSNIEGAIIDQIHKVGFEFDAIILNPAAYTHTSVAIADAIAAIKTSVLEVHISNVYAREDFRKVNMTARNCVGSICGLGLFGYKAGIEYFLNKANQ